MRRIKLFDSREKSETNYQMEIRHMFLSHLPSLCTVLVDYTIGTMRINPFMGKPLFLILRGVELF